MGINRQAMYYKP